MRIVLLHYHQRPSGVNQVIEAQRRVLSALGHDVILPELPELDYGTHINFTGLKLLQGIEKSVTGPVDFWIIHNPTLGKNAHFPDFIRALGEKGVPVVLQCHDFAEDGRPSNYHSISQCEYLFPLAPHIHYALINSRDAETLKATGIPAAQVHFLPNAVTKKTLATSSSDCPFIFYPVRGIRRKNLGELCLWSKLAPTGARFAIAARPENPDWIPYFDAWKQFSQDENLPIEFEVVSSDHPFEEWLEKATHLATTSIAEGFGLTFIEPHFLNRPLIGRDLPEITRDFRASGLNPGMLYSEIPIPKEHLNLQTLKEDFLTQINATFAAYGQPLDVESAWKNFTSSTTLDFGNLPESHQRKLIKNYDFAEFKRWLRQALAQNPELRQNTSLWSETHYQERMDKLLLSVTSSSSGPLEFLPKELILNSFLKPARFHFLRT